MKKVATPEKIQGLSKEFEKQENFVKNVIDPKKVEDLFPDGCPLMKRTSITEKREIGVNLLVPSIRPMACEICDTYYGCGEEYNCEVKKPSITNMDEQVLQLLR